MSNYRIIYPNDADGVSVIVPAPGIEQSEALKSVPVGKPYLIVHVDDIPAERTFRNAWQADFTNAPTKG
jgi:hypothetical protein